VIEPGGQGADEGGPELPPAEPERVFVVFSVAPAWFAVEAAAAEELAVLQRPTPVPGAPRYVAGLANVRGRITALLDLRSFLALEAPAAEPAEEAPLGRILVVSSGRMRAGIISDRVSGLAKLAAQALSAPDVAPGERAYRFAQAQFHDPTAAAEGAPRSVVVLDVARLLEAARAERNPA
jgi:purine-binding chemotaxis protein CheW